MSRVVANNSGAGAQAFELRGDTAEELSAIEMEAYDRLPVVLRHALDNAPLQYSAVEVMVMMDRGVTVETLARMILPAKPLERRKRR